MVEFGLKLQDNKVSKWSSHYMNYERLKKLLKTAKAAMKNRDELRDRYAMKLKALRVKASPGDGISGVQGGLDLSHQEQIASSSPARNSKSVGIGLNTLEEGREHKSRSNPDVGKRWGVLKVKLSGGNKKEIGGEGGSDNEQVDERTSLLAGSVPSPPTYNSDRPRSPLSPLLRDAAISNVTSMANMAKSLFDIKGDLKEQLKKADTEFNVKHMEFGAVLKDECRRVEEFYVKKIREYVTRLEILEDAVQISDASGKQGSGVAGSEVTPRRHKYSIVEVARALKGKDVLSTETPSSKSKRSNASLNLASGSDEEDDQLGVDNEDSLGGSNGLKKLLESDSVKRAVVDLHRNVKLLENFSIMNYTGFIKIVKKYDKTIVEGKGSYKHLCADTRFHDGNEATTLGVRMEHLYADWFCEGNLLQARAQMLPKVGDNLLMDWSQLRFGYRMGMCAVLALWVCWDCIWQIMVHGNKTIGATAAFPVFRACGGMLLIHWCWGISTFVWNRFRINYIYLFEFDPRNVNSSLAILNEAVVETQVFLVCMLLYYKSCIGAIPDWCPSGYYAAFLVGYTIKCMFFPWKMRKGLWDTVGNVLTSPFRPATFYSTYIADWATSMIKILQDWAWTLVYLFSGDFMDKEHHYLKHPNRHLQANFAYTHIAIPLICLLPIWYRLMQCLRRYFDTSKRWPNLANALKYSLSQTVTLFGAVHPLYMYNQENSAGNDVVVTFEDDDGVSEGGSSIVHLKKEMNLFQYFWISLFIVSSLYSFCWDVWMDWGLGRPEHKLLGPRLMFPHVSWYYVAIFMDIFLRFLWVTSLVPPDSGAVFSFPNYLTALVMAFEIFRRTVWGFFRLEQEHRANTTGYRRVDFVPLHFNTGHEHQYKGKGEERGLGVLMEVLAVAAVVISISVASIVAAQRETENRKSWGY
mmetsp:Transcript_22017/g.45866  ORF Transcript_22017/g.45866 Transcript_22017/m.45866 type:complete len:920 (-) Transcript_22017:91-2850(-)|eukprot:CAMPEP_0118644454 /NCGR_PEP_ID=MMETSP0785-20121206/6956_1 /TAXON_ID=91992 /ORGANISM="Bolidomonas pacifica, Strain CCMP 1866" /LENGTH=919 /DNA_ID=CAMNT_0006536231 /DNA_START=187 /DNA_END=2946 /DNA_ORIENTATION=+